MNHSILTELEPKEHHRLIDLVEEAGFDIQEWSNFKGGASKASVNPKYCYEWCLGQQNRIILNLWHDGMIVKDAHVIHDHNYRTLQEAETGVRRTRARRMDETIRVAFKKGVRITVIILKPAPGGGRLGPILRRLDPIPWVVTAYDDTTGDCTIGRTPIINTTIGGHDPELDAFEGTPKYAFYLHRTREWWFRQKKIEQTKAAHNGLLVCEVPGCGFDFAQKYGVLGDGYAQVHHKLPLSAAPNEGFRVTLDQLAIVCANCHVMIHKGGESRSMESLIPKE